MESYILEILNLFGRWLHMITGIAWIGASFYFVWLDNHLLPPLKQSDADQGVGGEVWSVHGGGMYHAQKYLGAPPRMPEHLHWFKWEAYSTFLSGLFLLILIYWYGAELYTIDPQVLVLSKPAAIGIGIATLVLGWLIYDLLCRSAIGNNDKWMGLAILVFISLTAFVLSEVFSGRAAFIHYGAMLGTIMVANVFFVIIPGQKKMVGAIKAGKTPDPIHGIRGKQRSVHNTYFTLPVLFVMISNHYALSYNNTYNWLILIAISLAGALIRVYFVARHKGQASPFSLIFAGILLAASIVVAAPKPAAPVSGEAVSFAEVKQIVVSRCTACHSQTPTQAGFASAPSGILLDTDVQLLTQAPNIYQQSVVAKAMPLGNLTGMTDEERTIINRWFIAGARP
ncbi:MAG: urate hydroxylase PuuD [Proteobacteria bacterium]|nr:urate hydroxylase PuuD [Pseudomonadota bacterium]